MTDPAVPHANGRVWINFDLPSSGAMSNQRYPEEFKIQAVNQVTEKQLPVSEVAARLGVSVHSLYAWIKRYTKPQEQRVQEDDQSAELRRLRAELKRVTEERDW
jgi:transposase